MLGMRTLLGLDQVVDRGSQDDRGLVGAEHVEPSSSLAHVALLRVPSYRLYDRVCIRAAERCAEGS
jgi:hypothetical protein